LKKYTTQKDKIILDTTYTRKRIEKTPWGRDRKGQGQIGGKVIRKSITDTNKFIYQRGIVVNRETKQG
jgi:hypothetical protein